MKTRKASLLVPLLLSFQVSSCSGERADSKTNEESPWSGVGFAAAEDTCLNSGNIFYFAGEINGTLCGYGISRECTGSLEGQQFLLESNLIFMKLSVLGQGVDNSIHTLYGMDQGSRRISFCRMKIRNGESEIVINSKITGDTAWYTTSNSPEPRKVLLAPDVILETSLRSPHLLKDFVQEGIKEKTYRTYNPLQGEVIKKQYLKRGDTTLRLTGSSFSTIILEETDLSTGQRSTIWLNRADGMTVKILIGNRNIYLADASVKNRIRSVNYDEVIVAKVNRIIPEFSSVNRMKVRARIEAVMEVITAESLSFPGQSFTGMVKDNFIDGIFELEPKRYDGTSAPPFPPDFTGDTVLKRFLEPELVIESDDPILIAEAQRITKGAANSWEAIRRLSQWVADSIEGAIPGGISAINTFKMRQGECGGHSRLMAAFCRAVGIPARLSVGCIYITKYGGCFAQHAWTEVFMGEAGWIAVDPTLFEIDFVDAGHIRLGEKAQFRPKEMEILEYATAGNHSVREDSVPRQYQPYIGKYIDRDRNRVFRILYQNQGLALDIPGQMILQLEEPDDSGLRYPVLTKQISINFREDIYGSVETLIITERKTILKTAPADSIAGNHPESLKRLIGRYSFPDGKTRELTASGECLQMYDPIRRSTEPLKFHRSGEGWKEDSGRYEFRFETNERNEVIRMILYITFPFPKENL